LRSPESASRFVPTEVEANHAFHALGRHFRVSPQRPVTDLASRFPHRQLSNESATGPYPPFANGLGDETVVDRPSFQHSPESKLWSTRTIRSPDWLLKRVAARSRRAEPADSIARGYADDGCAEAKNSDTSHGVQCLPTKSASRIVNASTCLTDAFRSQGFSPSQRLDPLEALWLCFAPLPSIGFEPSELFPLSQPLRLSAPDSLVPFSRRRWSR
jgi:hypothetical protein